MKRIIFLDLIFMIMAVSQSVLGQCPTVNATSPPPAILDCGVASVKLIPLINAGPGMSPGQLTYTWSCPPNATTTIPNSMTLTTNTPGTYTISVTNPTSMCTVSSTMMVVPGLLVATLSAVSYTNTPQIVNFVNLSYSSSGSASIITTWNFGNGQTSVTTGSFVSPVVTYMLPGTYTVTIIVQKGVCKDTAVIVVYPGLPQQAWVGLEELQFSPGAETKKYFDLMGNEQALEKNKVLIEQVGIRRRKIFICD